LPEQRWSTKAPEATFGFQRKAVLGADRRATGDPPLAAQLTEERRARLRAEAAAERLAAAVAQEHTLRMQAERQAEKAFRELEMAHSHRALPSHRQRRGWRRRRMWRRLRHRLAL
jgi:hypothetical protein